MATAESSKSKPRTTKQSSAIQRFIERFRRRFVHRMFKTLSEDVKDNVLIYYNKRSFMNFESVCFEFNEISTAGELCKHLSEVLKIRDVADFAIIEDMEPMMKDNTVHMKRSLEDHESVEEVHHNMHKWKDGYKPKFCFIKDVNKKYDYVKNPLDFFSLEMVVPVNDEEKFLTAQSDSQKRLQIQKMLMETDEGPVVRGYMFTRNPDSDDYWARMYFVLKDKVLYYVIQRPETYMHEVDTSKMNKLLTLEQFDICMMERWSVDNVKWEFHFALKISDPGSFAITKELDNPVHIFACETDKERFNWITGMRLQKYGGQLRQNYNNYETRKLSHESRREEAQESEEGAVGGVATSTEMPGAPSTSRPEL